MDYSHSSNSADGETPFGISQENWDITKLLVKIGVVGTALSIPVGIWAIKRWPNQPIIPAIILTGLGLAVKEVMLSHAGEEEPLASELEGETEPELAGYGFAPAY